MSIDALGRLYELFKVQGGLSDECRVSIPESREIISKYFNKVLFSGCLRALDRTYIDMTIPEEDKSRYQIRKSKISTNVLGWMRKFASDSRVLRNNQTDIFDAMYKNGPMKNMCLETFENILTRSTLQLGT
ncbi:hypothetical protein AHAS_Ahas01G0096600 [Arachis hypogaea]